MRRITMLATAILLAPTLVVATESTGDEKADAAKVESCVACHNSVVSLKGRGQETILEQIMAIRAGLQAHPPGLVELDEKDLAAIAAYFDAAD